MQDTGYAYTLQGWLKGMNSMRLAPTCRLPTANTVTTKNIEKRDPCATVVIVIFFHFDIKLTSFVFIPITNFTETVVIKSAYILDILDLLLDGDAEGTFSRGQIQFLSEEEYEYTGGGLLLSFSHTDDIFQFRSRNPNLTLDGVKIVSTEFSIEAEATLFFKNGIISNLDLVPFRRLSPT
jgi:hypothetical protein